MANPRWWMDAGDEAFSIIGKALDKADPVTDAILRVVARRTKSMPGQKFYDPEQDIMQRFPANVWKQALDRVQEIRTTSNKDADVVTPWQWDGPRPGEMSGLDLWGSGPGVAVKQFDKAARNHKDAAGNVQRSKPFGAAWKDAYEWMSKPEPGAMSTDKKTARKRLGYMFSTMFGNFERAGFPREWTGEAAIAAYRRARNTVNTDYPLYKYAFDDTLRDRGYRLMEAVKSADVPNMTNRQRALFFELFPDWDESYEDLGDFVRITTEMD